MIQMNSRGTVESYSNIDNHETINKLEWKGDYDGSIAKIDIDENMNGKKKHINMQLTNDELLELLKTPSDLVDLEKRLKQDYPSISIKSKSRKSSQSNKSRKSKSNKKSKTKSKSRSSKSRF